MSEITLPSHKEAEEAFIGILINHQDIFSTLTIYPTPGDFWLDRHQIIIRTIYELADNGAQIDVLSIAETLKSNKLLEKIGNISYLTHLTNQGLISKNVDYYAKLIIEKSQRRRFIQHALEMLELAQDESSVIDSIIEESEKAIFSITEQSNNTAYNSMQSFFGDFLQDIEYRSEHYKQGDFTGIPTSFPQLDKLLTGLHNGEMIVIGARPSMGKTALALNLVNNIALQSQVPAAFFSLEMSGQDIVTRLVCMCTGIDGQKFRQNMITSHDIEHIIKKFSSKIGAPLYISDTSSMSIFDIRVQARRLVKIEGVKVIFIDYLGLIDYRDNSRGGAKYSLPKFEIFSEISRQIKALARELNIPIVVLTQLNRDSENKEPNLSNIRDSGAIEQDADVIMFIHRENRDSHEARVIVAKQRNGPVGVVFMEFTPYRMTFLEKVKDTSQLVAEDNTKDKK